MTTPYDRAVRDDLGELYFLAILPAFRKLGARFEQLRESAGGDESELEVDQVREIEAQLADRAEAVEEGLIRDQAELHERLAGQGLLEPLGGGPNAADPEAIGRLLDAVTAAGAERLAAQGIPAAPLDEHKLAADFEATARASEGDERPARLPFGTVIVVCGELEEVSEPQKSLFRWLDDHQDRLVSHLAEALREKYRELLPTLERHHRAKAGERPFLPAVVDGHEPDDLFLVREVHLDPRGAALGLVLRCAFLEDEPMGVLVEEGEIIEIGPVDVAYVAAD